MRTREPDLGTQRGCLEALLVGVVEELDISPELAEQARVQYGSVGRFLNSHGDNLGTASWDVYAQGSFPLGTVVRPKLEVESYDIDLVCQLGAPESSTTPARLKQEMGKALAGYAAQEEGMGIREARRCWTLECPHLGLHMDVLPSLPDRMGGPTGILITDHGVATWLKSDPKGYVGWFKARMEQELRDRKMAFAAERRSTTEEVPDFLFKTTLQQSVQALKRHRNIFFQDDWAMRPPSILVTTLAAHAYQGDQNLYEAVVMMAGTMASYIQRDGQGWCVPNPSQPEENFADKWAANPELPHRFFAWIEQLKRDLDDLLLAQGLDRASIRLGEGWGKEVAARSAKHLGQFVHTKREAGALTMVTPTGMLSTKGDGSRK